MRNWVITRFAWNLEYFPPDASEFSVTFPFCFLLRHATLPLSPSRIVRFLFVSFAKKHHQPSSVRNVFDVSRDIASETKKNFFANFQSARNYMVWKMYFDSRKPEIISFFATVISVKDYKDWNLILNCVINDLKLYYRNITCKKCFYNFQSCMDRVR